MNLATLDNLAINHPCWLQRCSALAKLLFVVAVLVLLLTNFSLIFIAILAGVLVAMAVTNRLPFSVLAPLVALPMFFASIFALSAGDWHVGVVLIGRAGLAALTVVLVFVTTPPVHLIGLISMPMPAVFGELLYFTYRSFFLVWASLGNTLTAVRLRRGKEKLSWSKISSRAHVYGATLVRAWDLAGRQYSLLRVRGLGQGLQLRRKARLRRYDWGLFFLILLLAGGWYYAKYN